MYETNGCCMQCLSGDHFKTVLNELLVLGKRGTLQNFVPAIFIVVEDGMTDMLHVYPYLMRTPCFKFTPHQRNVSKSFDDLVMCYCMLAVIAVWKYIHDFPV